MSQLHCGEMHRTNDLNSPALIHGSLAIHVRKGIELFSPAGEKVGLDFCDPAVGEFAVLF